MDPVQRETRDDLKVNVSEAIKVADVGSPAKPLHGFVAVLDALGASVYSREEADEFLKARDEIMRLIYDVAVDTFDVQKDDLRIFTFNDSIVLTYVRKNLALQDLTGLCGLLRAFEASFLMKRILFRGALSFGELYRVDDKTNSVMGPAVSDAAAWYERADWLGIHTTPRATIYVQSLLQENPRALDHVLINYAVPLKDRGILDLKAINWPKGLYLQQKKEHKRAKAVLLGILGGMRTLPAGAESKYFNALRFYEHCERETFGSENQQTR